MTDIDSADLEPNYLARLALHSAPFNTQVEASFFYSGGQAEHRLNLLLHLLRSSRKIANLIAEQGMGKSSLLQQLQLRAGDELRICFINCEGGVDSTFLMAQCLLGLGVDSNDIRSTDDPQKVLRQRLEQLVKLAIQPILLLDNADDLAEGTLAEVSEWLTWQNEGKPLFGGILASKKLLTLSASAQSRIQAVDLPPLVEHELSDYLNHRLKITGYQQASPFTSKDLNTIFQQSSGKPSVVNQLAHQKLLGISRQASKFSIVDLALTHSIARWSGLVIVVIGLLALLFIGKNFSQWESDNQADINDNIILQTESVPVSTVDISNQGKNDDEQAQRDELAELLAELPSDLTEIEQLEAKTSEKLVEVHTISDFKNEDWILRQDKNSYTFQLMGSWDRDEIVEYIAKYALEGNVAVFNSLRQDKVWYVLLYGSFSDKQQAILARSNWPEPLNTVPTWLRRFNSVQQQIKGKPVIQQ